MSSSSQYKKQRRHDQHQQNLAKPGEDNTQKAEILRELSEIDDLPINPQDDEVMGQLISKLTSTANLTPEEVRSNEWVREYIYLLYICRYPRPHGLTDWWRGYAHGDYNAEREALDPEKRAMLEALVMNTKLALTRSEDAKVIEESVHTVNESITRDESDGDSSSGGILGRIRG